MAAEFEQLLGGAQAQKDPASTSSIPEWEEIQTLVQAAAHDAPTEQTPAYASLQQQLSSFAQNPKVAHLHDLSRLRLLRVCERMAHWLAEGKTTPSAAGRFLDWVQLLLRHPSYLALLQERPSVLERLLRLLGAARWPARYLQRHPELIDELANRHMLRERLSPEQIAGKLRSMNIPSLRDAYVCRETIYNAIYALPVGELRKELIVCLRQGKTTRRPRSGGVDRRGQIPEMVSIHVRPPEIEDRLMPGHWEGDLIKGKANASSVGTLVERTSGYLMLVKMNDATATSALEGFSAALNSMPLEMRKSMTYDQGREMARHAEITQRTGVAIYFCDPHSPWQRGSCENTNGLLRQMMPKGTDLSVHDQQALDAMADLLNNRPRETLDWRTPAQVFRELMQGIAEQASATIH